MGNGLLIKKNSRNKAAGCPAAGRELQSSVTGMVFKQLEIARVGWVERSETHQWVVVEMMGFGYRVYPSYTDYAQGVYQARVGWGEVRTPTFDAAEGYVGVPSSPQPTVRWQAR
jgi:hypothetical protein